MPIASDSAEEETGFNLCSFYEENVLLGIIEDWAQMKRERMAAEKAEGRIPSYENPPPPPPKK